MTGAILCSGGRTVCGVLRCLGKSGEEGFSTFHRILNHRAWDALLGSRMLLQQLAGQDDEPIVIGIDEHLERRGGRKIHERGYYRDPVRSSKKQVVKAAGLRWVSMMVLKRVSWAKRVFALPFLTTLAPSEESPKRGGSKHKSLTHWILQMVCQVRRWLPERLIILVGDGTYATAELCWLCYKQKISLVSRLRRNARLFALPPFPSGRGRPAQKGKRLPTPHNILCKDGDYWQQINVRWYGGCSKLVEMFSMSCIWHVQGYAPLPVRLVFVRDPSGSFQPITLISTGLDLTREAIIEHFVARWSMEVTFREAREHLGVETQRQWSRKAIARTTPVLLALYTLVVMMAEKLMCKVPVLKQQTSWYSKESLTFSDLLSAVRRHLWLEGNFLGFGGWGNHLKNIPSEALASIAEMLAMAA